MVVEHRIRIVKFVLHQTDRDPINGGYGGDRIYVAEPLELEGDWEIKSFDETYGILRVKAVLNPTLVGASAMSLRHTFIIDPNAKSDRDLYKTQFIDEWNKIKHNYKGDENYSDYKPALYIDLHAMKSNDLEVLAEAPTGVLAEQHSTVLVVYEKLKKLFTI
jgi:hypothetical protein